MMTSDEKRALYQELAIQLAALLAGESDAIAHAANTAALIYHGLPDLNWAGFYFAFARPPHDPSRAYPHPFPPPPAGEGDTPRTSLSPPLPGLDPGITGEDPPSFPPPRAREGQGG